MQLTRVLSPAPQMIQEWVSHRARNKPRVLLIFFTFVSAVRNKSKKKIKNSGWKLVLLIEGCSLLYKVFRKNHSVNTDELGSQLVGEGLLVEDKDIQGGKSF